MTRALFTQSFLGLLLACCLGCASTSSVTQGPKGGAPSADDAENKLEKLEHELDVKRDRLSLAQLEAQSFEASHAKKLAFSTEELSFAEGKLATFKEFDAPTQVERGLLSLRALKDRAQEAADELAQIEIMYKDQDLDDVTAEFVVSRGRRRAERAAASIAIEERGHEKLSTRDLPAQEAKLQLAVDKARESLDKVGRDGDVARHKSAISIKVAQRAVGDAERELEKERKEGTQ